MNGLGTGARGTTLGPEVSPGLAITTSTPRAVGKEEVLTPGRGRLTVSEAACGLGDQTRKEGKERAFWPEPPMNPGVTNSSQVSCHRSRSPCHRLCWWALHLNSPFPLIPCWAWYRWLSADSG